MSWDGPYDSLTGDVYGDGSLLQRIMATATSTVVGEGEPLCTSVGFIGGIGHVMIPGEVVREALSSTTAAEEPVWAPEDAWAEAPDTVELNLVRAWMEQSGSLSVLLRTAIRTAVGDVTASLNPDVIEPDYADPAVASVVNRLILTVAVGAPKDPTAGNQVLTPAGNTLFGLWRMAAVDEGVSLPEGDVTSANYITTSTSVDEGQVHILLSDVTRGRSTLALSEDADWTLTGADGDYAAGEYGTQHGAQLLPDLDGDGRCELLVGAPGNEHAWLVTGAALARASELASLPDVASQELRADATASNLVGREVSLGGDVDGDGAADIAIGAEGTVWVVPLDLSVSVQTLDTGARLDGSGAGFGFEIDDPGDLDGDGLDDLLVSDPTDTVAMDGAGWIIAGWEP